MRTVFNQIICESHEDLEDETAWELVGFYTSESSLEERRYYLEEQGITSVVVETDDDTIELYVPEVEKEDAYNALASSSEETISCSNCHVEFASEMQVCPLCGVREKD
jgi:hypothetical protein